jgi:hypothetical protein
VALDDGTALSDLLFAAFKQQLAENPAGPPKTADEGARRLADAIALTLVPYLKQNAVPSIANVQTGTQTRTGTLT